MTHWMRSSLLVCLLLLRQWQICRGFSPSRGAQRFSFSASNRATHSEHSCFRHGRRRGSYGKQRRFTITRAEEDTTDAMDGRSGVGRRAVQGPGGSSVSASSRFDSIALSLAAVLTVALLLNRVLNDPALAPSSSSASPSAPYSPVAVVDAQSRADLIALAAVSGLALNSIAALDVTSREAESVNLRGTKGRGLSKLIMEGGRWNASSNVVCWASTALLDAIPPAETVVIAWRGVPLLRQGIIPVAAPPPSSPNPTGGQRVQSQLGRGPIATRARSEGSPVYLPALQQLPGRAEFMAAAGGGGGGGGGGAAVLVPPNTQALVVAAVGEHGLLLVGSGTARGFTPKHLDDIFLVCQPLQRALEAADVEVGASS